MLACAHPVAAWFLLAAAPHPRATFAVTVKRRIEPHVKLSTWTNLTIRPDGTLQTSPPRRLPPPPPSPPPPPPPEPGNRTIERAPR